MEEKLRAIKSQRRSLVVVVVMVMVNTLGPPRFEKGCLDFTKTNARVPPSTESQHLLSFVVGKGIHSL